MTAALVMIFSSGRTPYRSSTLSFVSGSRSVTTSVCALSASASAYTAGSFGRLYFPSRIL